MGRMRNLSTGVVVNVSDETAAVLGSGYERVEVEGEKKPAAKKATASRKSKS